MTGSEGLFSDDNLFNYQAKVIKELAAKESCVIVGRCVNYVFKDRPNTLSVLFMHPGSLSGSFHEKISGMTERD